MTVPSQPPVVPPAQPAAQVPAPQPDAVVRHTTPPQESEIVRAMKAKDAAIETQKTANETLQRALDMSNQQNETLMAMMEKRQDDMTALQEFVAGQAPPDPAQPAQPQAVANALTVEQMRAMIREESTKAAQVVMEPFAATVAVISTDGDRSAFERQATTLYGLPFRLTEAQHEAVKAAMVKHPTMQYQEAIRFLEGDLAIQPPAQSQLPAVPGAQPTVPAPLAAPGQPAPAPMSRTPMPPTTPPGGQAPKPATDYEPHELIRAARNAEEAGSKTDQEAILVQRITQGTVDQHNEFGDMFQGEKKPARANVVV